MSLRDRMTKKDEEEEPQKGYEFTTDEKWMSDVMDTLFWSASWLKSISSSMIAIEDHLGAIRKATEE